MFIVGAIKFGYKLYECVQGKRQFSSLLERKSVTANGSTKVRMRTQNIKLDCSVT